MAMKITYRFLNERVSGNKYMLGDGYCEPGWSKEGHRSMLGPLDDSTWLGIVPSLDIEATGTSEQECQQALTKAVLAKHGKATT